MVGPIDLDKIEVQNTPTLNNPTGIEVLQQEDHTFSRSLFFSIFNNITLSQVIAGKAAGQTVALPGNISKLVAVLDLATTGAVNWLDITTNFSITANGLLQFVTDQTGKTLVVLYVPIINVVDFVLANKINTWR